VTTTSPLVAPAVSSLLIEAEPPVALAVAELYPPGTETLKVTSTSVATCTSVLTEGALTDGASATEGLSFFEQEFKIAAPIISVANKKKRNFFIILFII
jgi:hypothetical protein